MWNVCARRTKQLTASDANFEALETVEQPTASDAKLKAPDSPTTAALKRSSLAPFMDLDKQAPDSPTTAALKRSSLAPFMDLDNQAPSFEEELEKDLEGLKERIDRLCGGELVNEEDEIPLLVDAICATTKRLAEKHKDHCFVEVFRRHGLFEKFSVALRTASCPCRVKTQVLQSLGFFVSQLSDETSDTLVEYLLGILNPFFTTPPEDLNDEDVLSYFVTILKSLSNKLNRRNVRSLILNLEGVSSVQAVIEDPTLLGDGRKLTLHMPMFYCAVSLVDNQDLMVQTHAQTAILQILRISKEYPCVLQIATEHFTNQKKGLLPKLLAMRAERRRRVHQKCKWMWGDPSFGQLSEAMPWRWSKEMNINELLGDISRETKTNKRPILVKYGSDEKHPALERYSGASKAIGALNEILEMPFGGFVKDLYKEDIPEITTALQSKGF